MSISVFIVIFIFIVIISPLLLPLSCARFSLSSSPSPLSYSAISLPFPFSSINNNFHNFPSPRVSFPSLLSFILFLSSPLLSSPLPPLSLLSIPYSSPPSTPPGMLLHPLLQQKTNSFPLQYRPKSIEERIRRGHVRLLTTQIETLCISKNSSFKVLEVSAGKGSFPLSKSLLTTFMLYFMMG
jgi:hypothetical protein